MFHGDEFRDDYSSEFRTWYYINDESFGGEGKGMVGAEVMYYVTLRGMPGTYDHRLGRK